MTYNNKANVDLVHYLESMVNLDALDRMTNDLDEELKDSQRVMNEIKGMIDTLPSKAQEIDANGAELRHEELSNFLTSDTPKLLLSDMDENVFDGDIDLGGIIASMKSYTEDLKKNIVLKHSGEPAATCNKIMEPLNLEQYATSLDVLCKRLSSLKLNKTEDVADLNTELERKLSVLCDNVNMFTQMVQTKTKLGEVNKEWSSTEEHSDALNYDNLVNKLLSGINEVTYLLHRSN